jgi:dTDP-4-amino-4,6-dideoxygalactose transaminase/CelD/BcsL family acetyltransferase involved in cellulose biosynthesis
MRPSRLDAWPPLPAGDALLHGLRALGLGQGDEVLVPAFHHGSEVEALVRAGCSCRFYDLGPGLEPSLDNLEVLLGPRTRALYLIHYLGFPQDAARWLDWARQRGLLLIEDAAQAWLGRARGRPLGSFGDLSILCMYRTVAVGEGGALLLGRPPQQPRAHRLEALHGRLRRQPDPAQRRRQNFERLLQRLGDRVPAPFATLPEGAAPFAFPVLVENKAETLAKLEQHGVRALDLWADPHPSLPRVGFERAARLRKHLVGLPVHQELRPRDLARITTAVRAAEEAPLEIDVAGELAPLRTVWSELAVQGRNVFATWEWASTWWEQFGRRRKPLVTICRSGDRVVGILPLYAWSTRPLRVLRLIGHGPADELGPVAADEDRDAVVAALGPALGRVGWDVFVGEQLPRDRTPWDQTQASRLVRREASPVLRFGPDGWQGFLDSRSRNFREQVRRRPRRLAREHRVAYRLADGSRDLDDELETLFRLHAERWSSTGTSFLRHRGFHRAFAHTALAQGWLRLWFLEVDGRPVAAVYGFRYAGVESYYQAGRDPAWDAYAPGFVLLAHAIRRAAEDGMTEYRLLRGGEAYKYRFATADAGLDTIALARGPGLGAALRALPAAIAARRVVRRVVGRAAP